MIEYYWKYQTSAHHHQYSKIQNNYFFAKIFNKGKKTKEHQSTGQRFP